MFTAGIGENSDGVRARGCQGLEGLASPSAPSATGPLRSPRTISADDVPVAVLVVSTNEELEIAEQTLAVVGG